MLLAQRRGSLSALLYGIAGFAGLTALLLAILQIEPSRLFHSAAMTAPARRAGGKRIALALGALFFLYVGSENSIAGWAAAYTQRMRISPENSFTLAPIFFWAALLAGRALTPVILLVMGEDTLVAAGLTLAAVGSGVLLVAASWRGVIGGVLGAGFGLASIYPLLIARLSRSYGERANRIGGVMFGLAGLGGATLPWLVGVISTQTGNLRLGLLTPLLALLAMLGSLIPLRESPAA